MKQVALKRSSALPADVCHKPGQETPLGEVEKLLFSLAQSWWSEKPLKLESECDSAVWDYVVRNGLGGFWNKYCSAGALSFSDMASTHYFSNMLNHQRCLKVCKRLQQAASKLAIPLVFFKGPVLVEQVYKDGGLRPYTDLDVLVSCRRDALRLIEACELSPHDPYVAKSFSRRITQPGRLHADADGWEVEFCYPVAGPCDPMFELLERHPERILQIPSSEGLSAPEPNLHLLLLLQHMARHLCCRTLWFLDIAGFIREFESELDWTFLRSELRAMECYHISSRILSFCEQLSGRSSRLETTASGWSAPFQNMITSTRHITSDITTMGPGVWQGMQAKALSFARYFLITDAEKQTLFRGGASSRWLIARFIDAMGLKWRPMYLLFSPLVMWVGRATAVPFNRAAKRDGFG